jgi:hypothetical protein
MSNVVLQVRERPRTQKEIRACLSRLSEMERLYWYPVVLPALGTLLTYSPEAQAPAQALLLAIREDINELRWQTGRS